MSILKVLINLYTKISFEGNKLPLDTNWDVVGLSLLCWSMMNFYFLYIPPPLGNGSYNVTAAETPKRSFVIVVKM